jgi:hypothetical protein
MLISFIIHITQIYHFPPVHNYSSRTANQKIVRIINNTQYQDTRMYV